MIARAAVLVLAAACLARADKGDVARGRELFRSCQGCHNTETAERKMGPSLRSLFGQVTLRNGKHADDANVREVILDGFNGMPSFRYSFRAAEIDDLMAYLHTLKGKPTESGAGGGTPGGTPGGAAFFKAYCVRCHDPGSRTAAAPDLRGRFQPEQVALVALVEEGHAGMAGLKEWLGEYERRVLFEYLKTY